MSSQGTESSQSLDQQVEQQKQFAEIFAYLPEQDIEQFYAHYQLWLMRRRVPIIERQLELLHAYRDENQQLVEDLRPSAVALAVLVRLQSSGVTNIDVLDQMLDRGEDWLDRMMQRLDYCEQVEDFIQGDYTQWCIRSLEGAYDWIDTVLGLGAPTAETEVSYTNAPDVGALEATEELLLQKLRLDDEESALETTLSQPTRANAEEREIATPEASKASTAEQPATASEDSVHIPQPQPAAYDAMEVGIAEEFLLARESTTETSENTVQSAQTLEADWENIENAEARPDPWYSVNPAADAAPDAHDMMRDWVNVPQASDAPQAEISEPEATQVVAEAVSTSAEGSTSEIAQVAEEALVELVEPSEAENISQTENVELVAGKSGEEEEVVQANASEQAEASPLVEAQSEPGQSVESEDVSVTEEDRSETEMDVENEVVSVVEAVQHEEEPSPALVIEEAVVASSDEIEVAESPNAESEASGPVEAVVAESDSVTASHEAEVEERAPLEQAVVPGQAEVEEAASLVRITNPLEVDDTVSWSYVPFAEAESGEESSNARPWYEYLEQDERVAQMPQSWSGIEQPGAAAAPQSAFASEFVLQTPESPAAISFGQHEAIEEGLPEALADLQESGGSTQSESADAENEPEASVTLPVTSALQEELERLERERGVSQEPYPEIDATLPMVALKGREGKKQELSAEPEVPVGEAQEESSATADEPAATSEPGEAPVVGQGLPTSSDLSEMPAALLKSEMRSIQDEMRSIQDKVRSIQQNIREIPATPVQREVGEVPVSQPQQEIPATQKQDTVHEVAPPNEGTKPSARDAAPVESVEQPPEKIGLWRRLFGRKRKK